MRVPKFFAVIERGDLPSNNDSGEQEIIEVDPNMHVRIDIVPQDTIAQDPDMAATMAAAMQDLSNKNRGHLGFRVEYFAD